MVILLKYQSTFGEYLDRVSENVRKRYRPPYFGQKKVFIQKCMHTIMKTP